MQKYRFIGGLILVLISATMFLFHYGETGGRIAVSRRRMREEKKD